MATLCKLCVLCALVLVAANNCNYMDDRRIGTSVPGWGQYVKDWTSCPPCQTEEDDNKCATCVGEGECDDGFDPGNSQPQVCLKLSMSWRRLAPLPGSDSTCAETWQSQQCQCQRHWGECRDSDGVDLLQDLNSEFQYVDWSNSSSTWCTSTCNGSTKRGEWAHRSRLTYYNRTNWWITPVCEEEIDISARGLVDCFHRFGYTLKKYIRGVGYSENIISLRAGPDADRCTATCSFESRIDGNSILVGGEVKTNRVGEVMPSCVPKTCEWLLAQRALAELPSCPEGYNFSQERRKCISCPEGSVLFEGGTKCVSAECPPHFMWDADQVLCENTLFGNNGGETSSPSTCSPDYDTCTNGPCSEDLDSGCRLLVPEFTAEYSCSSGSVLCDSTSSATCVSMNNRYPAAANGYTSCKNGEVEMIDGEDVSLAEGESCEVTCHHELTPARVKSTVLVVIQGAGKLDYRGYHIPVCVRSRNVMNNYASCPSTSDATIDLLIDGVIEIGSGIQCTPQCSAGLSLPAGITTATIDAIPLCCPVSVPDCVDSVTNLQNLESCVNSKSGVNYLFTDSAGTQTVFLPEGKSCTAVCVRDAQTPSGQTGGIFIDRDSEADAVSCFAQSS